MSNTEPFDDDLEQPDDDAVEEAGWDAFWDETLRKEAAERGQAPTTIIRGVTVRIPQDLPLKYEAKAKRLKDSSDDAAFGELLAELFGTDVLDAWREAGMGVREFRVILAWGLSHGRGKPLTFREAYDLVHAEDEDDEGEGDGGGKASTPTSGASASTGRSSKPTSGANTATSRKTSRR